MRQVFRIAGKKETDEMKTDGMLSTAYPCVYALLLKEVWVLVLIFVNL